MTLMTSAASCVLGMYINSTFLLTGFLFTILAIVAIGFLMYQVSNHALSESERIGYLWALAFFMGFEIGPAIHMIAGVYPELLTQAGIYTTSAFSGFSAISLFS